MIRLVFPLILLMWLWPAPLIAQEDGAALVEASRRGNIREVERLLAAGVDVDGQDEDGTTALTVASNFCDAEMVRLLLDAGAETDRPGSYGENSLMRASWCDTADVTAFLLTYGAEVDWLTDFGETALMRASQSGQVEIVKLLLEAGADVNRPNEGNFTALNYAILTDKIDTTTILLAAGAEFSSPTGSYELSLATDWDIFDVLLKAGADPEAADITPLMIAAFQGDAEKVRALLHANTADDPGPALHYAVFSGDPAILSTLLDAGAEVDCNVFGWTALMHASERGQTEMVARLLAAGASLNFTGGTYDHTALIYASREGQTEIVKLLLDAGAAVDRIGRYDDLTALMHASLYGHTDIVRLLLEAGADPLLRNRSGETALDLSRKVQQARITALLEAAMEE